MIRIKEEGKSLVWDTGSYNTRYFKNVDEFNENVEYLRSKHYNFSTWTESNGYKALQILQ